MSNFVLVPVDGGDPVQVPPGETVLGRGPLLGVSDKRVSRNHGLLENLDGQLRLKPTHVNPCFVQSSPSDAPRSLDKDRWFCLHDGVLLSLLPGRHVFRVQVQEVTPRNSQMFEEEPQKDPEAPPPDGQDQGQTPPPDLLKESTVEEEAQSPERTRNQHDSATQKEAEPNQMSRKRVLPPWMLTVAAPSTSTPKKGQSQAAEKTVNGSSTNKNQSPAKQATPTTTSSTEEAEPKEKETMPQKKKQKNEGSAAPSKKDPDPDQTSSVASKDEAWRGRGGEDPDSVAMETDGETKRGETSTRDTNAPPRASSDSEDRKDGRVEAVGSSSEPALLKGRLRTPCPYGKHCYRKNPLHFQECCHPGDTDYEDKEDVEDIEDKDRPECPYGTDCYRKNPLHRKEFKHTKRPARKTQTAVSKTEDEDVSEDSFINDETEDEGGDSDYAPPLSEDSEDEDIRRLQREARAFMKTDK